MILLILLVVVTFSYCLSFLSFFFCGFHYTFLFWIFGRSVGDIAFLELNRWLTLPRRSSGR